MTQQTPDDWWLDEDAHGVTARDRSGPVARVEVAEDGAGVQLVFWADERLPRQLRADLTRLAFRHPALRTSRPVSVALPHREVDVLDEVRAHVTGARTHVAGATCLLDGRVR
jgi:hypothetical protein